MTILKEKGRGQGLDQSATRSQQGSRQSQDGVRDPYPLFRVCADVILPEKKDFFDKGRKQGEKPGPDKKSLPTRPESDKGYAS